MDTLTNILILFGIGNIAGFINVMAGGGSSITLPVLILMGLDAAAANGTNRVAIVLQNISAITSFKKEKYSDFGLSLKMSLFTLPGAIAGSIVAVRIDDHLFKTILAVVMIGIVITMVIPRKKIVESDIYKNKPPWTIYLAMTGIGFYGGFIQVGVGFILMAALHYILRLGLVKVNMHKVFIVLIYTIPALIVFMVTGNVNYWLGISLALGNALGAWWAAKITVKKGEKVIKAVLIVAILVMSLKFLHVF